MKDLGVKDTAAYRVIRQVVDHTWGPDEKLDDEEIVSLCRDFRELGGTWRGIMDGDMRCVKALENAIDAHIRFRMLSKAASVLAGDGSGR